MVFLYLGLINNKGISLITRIGHGYLLSNDIAIKAAPPYNRNGLVVGFCNTMPADFCYTIFFRNVTRLQMVHNKNDNVTKLRDNSMTLYVFMRELIQSFQC